MKFDKGIVLGAGMTGLAIGVASGFPVYEARWYPGGICSSYYIRPGQKGRLYTAPEDEEAYRFEIGGGHWIFGADPVVLRFIDDLAPVSSYERRSGVYFSEQDLYVPYPLQNHLKYLDDELAAQALTEMASVSRTIPQTMADWIEQSFGSALTDLFFAPFHELYTAGLWTRIAPQDAYKSPVNYAHAVQGALEQAPPVGYNATFVYPKEGLDALARGMAEKCDIRYEKRAERIDIDRKQVEFSDGTVARYETLISTLPLNRVVEMTGLGLEDKAFPSPSVLVINIGATRGSKRIEDQWLYVPDSKSDFHRVGFYSNVDRSFLPISSRKDVDRVSIYVERAYPEGDKPTEKQIWDYTQSVIAELQRWGFIETVEVVDPTWIEVAYTWAWPESKWKSVALHVLKEHDIVQVGRYARWVFQGIADSIRDGLVAGITFALSG